MIHRARRSPSLAFSLPLHIVVMILAFGLISLKAANHSIFMRIGGMTGESPDPNHQGFSEVIAFQYGVSQGTSLQGPEPQFQDLIVYKYVDSLSVNLQRACTIGEHLTEVHLVITPAANTQYYFFKFSLAEVVITSYSLAGDALNGGARPVEIIKLKFGRISWNYVLLGIDGTPQGSWCRGWDIAKNSGWDICPNE
jgi:type VI secretion system secreted protein Hcp